MDEEENKTNKSKLDRVIKLPHQKQHFISTTNKKSIILPSNILLKIQSIFFHTIIFKTKSMGGVLGHKDDGDFQLIIIVYGPHGRPQDHDYTLFQDQAKRIQQEVIPKAVIFSALEFTQKVIPLLGVEKSTIFWYIGHGFNPSTQACKTYQPTFRIDREAFRSISTLQISHRLSSASIVIANCCNGAIPGLFQPFTPSQCPDLPPSKNLKLKNIPIKQRKNLMCYNQEGLKMHEDQSGKKGGQFSWILAKAYQENKGNAYKALAQSVMKYNSMCRQSQMRLKYMTDELKERSRGRCPLIMSIGVTIVDDLEVNGDL